jgi:hypothetical protein
MFSTGSLSCSERTSTMSMQPSRFLTNISFMRASYLLNLVVLAIPSSPTYSSLYLNIYSWCLISIIYSRIYAMFSLIWAVVGIALASLMSLSSCCYS